MIIDRPTPTRTPGQRFRDALAESQPLTIVGTPNPYAAMLAERAGHKAIYVGGGMLATHSRGLPDLALTTLTEVLEDVRRITDATDVPLLVDVDTGFGGMFNIARMMRGLIKDGPTRRWSAPPRWSTASRPAWTRAPMNRSSSWRAPTR